MALSEDRRAYLTDSAEELKGQIANLEGEVAQQESEAKKYSEKAKANRSLLENLQTDLASKEKELGTEAKK